MDNVDKETRSRTMAAVKSKGNKSTELKLVKILRGAGLKGWRRHLPVVGTPDFCWPKLKVALFVDGCFWHGCPTCHRLPSTNVEYWLKKVKRNKMRDRRVARLLREAGWSVIRVWECHVEKPRTIKRIAATLARRG